jgi:hypothetical protein
MPGTQHMTGAEHMTGAQHMPQAQHSKMLGDMVGGIGRCQGTMAPPASVASGSMRGGGAYRLASPVQRLATIVVLAATAIVAMSCCTSNKRAWEISPKDPVVNEGDGVRLDILVRKSEERPFRADEWWSDNKRLTTDWKVATDRLQSFEIETGKKPEDREAEEDPSVLISRLGEGGAVFVYWAYPDRDGGLQDRPMGVETITRSELGEEGRFEILLGKDRVEVKVHLKKVSVVFF